MEKSKILLDITNAIIKSFDLEEILELVYQRIKEYGIADYVDIAVVENEVLKPIRASNGSVIQMSEAFELYEIKLGNGLAGYAAMKNETVYVPEVKKDKRYIAARPDVESELVVPLRDEEKVIGILNFEVKRKNPYTPEDIKFLENLANEVAIAVRNAALFRKLNEEKSKLKALLSSLPEPVVLLDRENKIEIVNKEAEERFDIKPGDDITTVFGEEDKKRITELIKTPGKDVEVKIKDRYYNLKINIVGGFNGARIGTCMLFYDVTRQKEIDRMKADFTAMVIHDLRSPLTSIMGALDLLSEILLGQIEEKFYNILINAREDGMRLLTMINELLEVSRLERGKVELKKEKVNIRELVNISIRSLELVAQEKGVEIVCKGFEEDSYALVDKERIIRVIINLLDNAIKYTPRGKKITIKHSKFLKDGKEWIKIAVKDEGPGIPADKLPYIFEKYRKADTKKEGIGLGLAISKLVIEAHGGKIGVQSKEGAGAMFWFVLPTVER